MMKRCAVVMVAVALSACGDDDAGSDGGDAAVTPDAAVASDATMPSDDSAAPLDAATDAAAPVPTNAGCEQPLEPGESMQNLIPTDVRATKSYLLRVPESYDGSPMPLVLNLHGFINDGPQQRSISGMDAVAEAEGFIVAYPNGFGSLRAWNAGDCCAFGDQDRDDVTFLDEVIEHVAGLVCVDRSRIYSAGFSNGGFMGYRLACERSETYAAVGSVSGVLGIEPADCNPTRTVPVMHLHGTADLIVPHAGGTPAGFSLIFAGTEPPVFRSVAATVDAWVDIAGCSSEPTVDLEMDDVRCELREGCNDGAVHRLCTFEGGGHAWPGGDAQALTDAFGLLAAFLGRTPTSLDANQALWDFFSEHSL